MLITFSLGAVMRYSPAGIRTSSTVKPKGDVHPGRGLLRGSGNHCQQKNGRQCCDHVSCAFHIVLFSPWSRGSVLERAHFAREAKNAQCTADDLRVENE